MKSIKALIALGACVWLVAPSHQVSAAGGVDLVAHRAIYDLKLLRTRGNRPIEGVRGRIVYDFNGSACEGYSLSVRQVSELDSGEGKNVVTDLRATTWEDGAAKSFRFTSDNRMNQEKPDSVDGFAERMGEGVEVGLKKPKTRAFSLSSDTVFPTEHMRRVVEAAKDGKTILEFPVYDGSETGEKVFDTLTVIGQPVNNAQKPLTDAAVTNPQLAKMRRWPVSISYFDKSKADKTGEQTPVYSIQFEIFENGISRNLTLDYGDFAISGEMTQVELKPSKPCR